MAESEDNKKRKIDATRDEEEEEETDTSSEEEDERDDTLVTESKQAEISTFKIKSISENPERKISPILGYFPSGYNPLKKGPENCSTRVYKSVKSRNPANPRMELVVQPNNSRVTFVGTNYSGEATAPQLCNYALGVLDKETGVLKMLPIAANRIFRLDPKVREPQATENEKADEEATIEEKPRDLGSLSAKRDINRDHRRDTLRKSEEAGVGGQEGFVMKLDGVANAEALASTTDASSFHAQNMPPYNLDATTLDMAYPLDRIIGKGDWDCLLDSEVKPTNHPSFVRNRISKLEDIKDESKRKRMAAVLSYIAHLINFKDKHSMDGFSSAKHHRIPSRLIQTFSSMFLAPHDRKKIQDDKLKLLINYVLVLSLIADDFCSDPTDIAKDLRMSILTLRDYYVYLGCKAQKGTGLLTLNLPLTLGTVKKVRRKKAR